MTFEHVHTSRETKSHHRRRQSSEDSHDKAANDPNKNDTDSDGHNEDHPNLSNIHSEIIGLIEEECPPANVNTAIRLHEKQRIVLVKRRNKPEDHKKMSHRQIPNAWRRHGSFKVICNIGGWITSRGENSQFQHVTPGTSSTPDPKAYHLALHQDTSVLNQDYFKFKMTKNVDSQTLANAFGRQIAESAIHIRKSKHLTSKSLSKNPRGLFNFR